jgi:hypothetical protein
MSGQLWLYFAGPAVTELSGYQDHRLQEQDREIMQQERTILWRLKI